MVGQLIFVFENYDFMHYMIAFVKDERYNLTSWRQHYVPLFIVIL